MNLLLILNYINIKFLIIGFISGLVLSGSSIFIYTHFHPKNSQLKKVTQITRSSSINQKSSSPSASPSKSVTNPSRKVIQIAPPAKVSNFVTVCGLNLCLRGNQLAIHGATGYGTYDQPAAEITLATQGRINILEVVEFETQYHTLSDTMSEATWSRVDNFVANAKNAGLHVILNLSSYGQSLQAGGQTPTTVDWQPYLSFIANRTNKINGIQYKNDDTIAMVEIFGEIDAPNYNIHPGTEGTTAQMTTFFHRTETEWAALAPNILVSSGGFSYLNDPNSGIDWRTIVSDPANKVCDLEINSPDDLNISVNQFTNYCHSIGKPWFLAAWSSCYNSNSYPFHTPTDSTMAAHAQNMYSVAKGGSPATYAAVGADFWNLRNEGTTYGTCSLSPSFPQTWAVVQNN